MFLLANATNTSTQYYYDDDLHLFSLCHMVENVHELIPPCVARRRKKVGALYSAVSSLLAFISRAYPRFLSL